MDLGMRFRDRLEALSDALVHEFERLMVNINAAWLTQHTEDDGHGAITAYSVTLRKGTPTEVANGTKTGNLDADGLGPHKLGGPLEIGGVDAFGNPPAEKILLSLLTSGGAGTGASGAGIFLPRSFGLGESWSILVNRDNYDDSIGFYDVTSAIEVLKLYRTGAGIYCLSPSEDGVATVKLGDHTDSDFFFDECAATHFWERNDAGMGWWQDVTYAAGNFTASAGAWTVDAGDQNLYRWTLVGKTMTLTWDIAATDVTVGGVLRLAIPGGFTAAKLAYGVHRASDNGAAHVMAVCRTPGAGVGYIELFPTAAGGAFAATAADNTATAGTFSFEVQ